VSLARAVRVAVAVTTLGLLIGGLWTLFGAVDLIPGGSAGPGGSDGLGLEPPALKAQSLRPGAIELSWPERLTPAHTTTVQLLDSAQNRQLDHVAERPGHDEWDSLNKNIRYCVRLQIAYAVAGRTPVTETSNTVCLVPDGHYQ
jgi:hypothetical protein